MSDDNFGACVVLTMAPNDLPDTVEGGHHVTIAYFGDTPLHPSLSTPLLDKVADLAANYSGTGTLRTEKIEYFGEDGDAVVLTLDRSKASEAVQFREALLDGLDPGLQEVFDESETFPEYKPHMTLGYISKGLELEEDAVLPGNVQFTGIAVWNGEERINFKLLAEDELMHYGIIRRSGRYPWGSGKNPHQRSRNFKAMYDELVAQGLTQKEVAQGLGLNTRELREINSMAKSEIRKADESLARRLKDKGMSNVAIADRMGINESSVRNLLNPIMSERRSQAENTAAKLKDQIADGSYLDISEGSERYLGVSRTTLKTAIRRLEEQGYKVEYLNIKQIGTGKDTKTLILTDGSPTYSELLQNQDKIKIAGFHSDDGGKSWVDPKPPKSIKSSRLEVRYGPEGGADRDGVIEIRPGAADLSLGNNRYAQVRIAVDGTHYLKGMAIYNDNLPAGTDIRFNTNKTRAEAPQKLDALKRMSDDPSNPWGAVIKAGGQQGAINVVNEAGDWYQWSRNMSSQMLSKQSPTLAKQQLDLTYDIKKTEFDEINSLTNPTVKRHLMEKFADGADSSAVYLKAKGLPGTQNHVILPVPDMKQTEIFAPQYKNGEKVVLVRHPHGGKFEIPELTVNNRQKTARSIIGTDAIDAVGIHPQVAEQLSGADFDGDTVLVIPNRPGRNKVSTEKPLKDLANFQPRSQYGHDPGSKVEYKNDAGKVVSVTYSRNGNQFKGMTNTQNEMGQISNLITDMTIQGADNHEIARAVRHSMVVIDAEKHGLDYKQSYLDNGINELKRNYQAREDGKPGGAATIISRAKSTARVPERVDRRAAEGGPIDPETGERRYTETGATYTDPRTGKTVARTTKSTRMAEARDAHELVSRNGGTPIERVYADHANKLKALANQARKEVVSTAPAKYSPTAFKTYSNEVSELNTQLDTALKNAPLERRAQLIASQVVKQRRLANPGMDRDSIKKEETKALAVARARTGAGKTRITITPRQWEAIQAGAISSNKLTQILRNTDLDDIKKLATPRTSSGITPAQMARAKAMVAAGYTQAEVAAALGISTSSVNTAVNG